MGLSDKSHIFLDVDGVLLNFDRALKDYCLGSNEISGLHFEKKYEPSPTLYRERFNKEKWQNHFPFCDTEFVADFFKSKPHFPLICGARHAVNSLYERGYSLYVCTQSGNLSTEYENHRTRMLEDIFGRWTFQSIYFTDFYAGHEEKAKLIKYVMNGHEGDAALIDDSYGNMIAANEDGIDGYHFTGSWIETLKHF